MNYDTRALRNLINNAFDDSEFGEFCHDYFFEVYQNFSNGMTKKQKIQLLIDYCLNRDETDTLLIYLKQERPKLQSEIDSVILKSVLENSSAVSNEQPDFIIQEEKPAHLSKLIVSFAILSIIIVVAIILNLIKDNGSTSKDEVVIVSTPLSTNAPVQTNTSPEPTSTEPISTSTQALRLEQQLSPSQTPTLTSTPQSIGWTPILSTRQIDNMVTAFVPGGTFIRGSDRNNADSEDDEYPQHPVQITEFWIDQTEITNFQYNLCVENGVCNESLFANNNIYNGDNYPVVGVTWADASTYCEWVGGHLPTEAQWEYAARGLMNYTYPWGNEFDGTRANYCDINCPENWRDEQFNDGYSRTAPVGSYPNGASWVGSLDMSGNVWEWVYDWYDPNYYEFLNNTSPHINPLGPESGESRILRGGSWFIGELVLRSANRSDDTPTIQNIGHIGFRCASSNNFIGNPVEEPTSIPTPTNRVPTASPTKFVTPTIAFTSTSTPTVTPYPTSLPTETNEPVPQPTRTPPGP